MKLKQLKLKPLDALSLCLLPLGLYTFSLSPAMRPSPALTLTFPEVVESALDPGPELDDDGRVSPQFEAWAIQHIQAYRASQTSQRAHGAR